MDFETGIFIAIGHLVLLGFEKYYCFVFLYSRRVGELQLCGHQKL